MIGLATTNSEPLQPARAGRIHQYAQRRAPLPEGVTLTADCRPTVDPAEALAGMLLPMGGHRGFGIAVMWEILTGVRSGGPGFRELSGSPDRPDHPPRTSIYCLALNPEFSMPYETFVSRVDELVDTIHASRRAPGVDRITVPGERRHATAARRDREGIPIGADLAEALRQELAPWDIPRAHYLVAKNAHRMATLAGRVGCTGATCSAGCCTSTAELHERIYAPYGS